jgi:hypothetical protein
VLHARQDYQDRIVDLKHEIPEDEPVFLLRGQDIFCSTTLDFYLKCLKERRQELEDEAGSNLQELSPEEAAELNVHLLKEADNLYQIELAVLEHQRKVNLWPKKKTPDLKPK